MGPETHAGRLSQVAISLQMRKEETKDTGCEADNRRWDANRISNTVYLPILYPISLPLPLFSTVGDQVLEGEMRREGGRVCFCVSACVCT